MGVHSFWDIAKPTAKPVRLDSLQDRRMAVDASIWIYQFLKAVRDNEGNAVKYAHIVGFFRRICKLLYFGIKPVFVFDGGAPVLKRKTIEKRKERRQGKRDTATKTAKKLLTLQLQKSVNELANFDNNIDKKKSPTKDTVKSYKHSDEWDLPEISGFQYDEDDQRVLSTETFEKLVKSFDDELDNLDLDSINPASKEFEELPKSAQYLILSSLRLKSRLRMGYSKEQLEQMFPDTMEFSKFQIDMVTRRNFFTQKLLGTTGVNDGNPSKLTNEVVNRIAGKKDKEYRLTKSENGWTLGFGEFDGSEAQKAINLDKTDKNLNTKKEENLNELLNLKSNNTMNMEKKNLIGKLSEQTSNNNISGKEEANDGESDEFDDWEDVEIKTPEKKQIEDYSINAARLSHISRLKNIDKNNNIKNATKVGGQAFLDTRQDQKFKTSPIKTTQYIIHDDDIEENDFDTNHLPESSNDKETLKSYYPFSEIDKGKKLNLNSNDDTSVPSISHIPSTYNKAKLNKGESILSLDESDDDFTSQMKEMQAIEDYQKNKQLNNITSQKPYNDGVEMPPASATNATFEPALTETEQNFNMITSKIPEFNFTGDSLLFSGVREKSSEKNKKNEPIPELPSWFQDDRSNTLNSDNPYSTSYFVKDTNDSNKDRGKEPNSYALLSNFAARELIEKEQQRMDDSRKEEVDSDDIQIIENNNSSINLTNNLENTEKDKIVESDIEIIEEPSKEVSKENNEISSTLQPQTIEDVISVVENPQDKTDSRSKPLIFDYDFSEDEENELAETMRKENEDFNNLRSSLQDNNGGRADKVFIEDELFEQQMKEKRDSDEVTPEMATDVQELLSRFGIPFVVAPMEAEAQCAELLQLGLIDGVITDDSDVFLFGGTHVYKNMFQEKNYVEYYSSDSLKRNLGLDRENMIELAQLLGSDYTTGLKGMGPVASMEIIAEFGDLENFRKWFIEGQFNKAIQEKEPKYQKDLRKKLVKNEVIIDEEFPSIAVSEAYRHPEVDHDKIPFQWGTPDLDMLRSFMRSKINWPQEKSDEVLIPLIRAINHRKQQAKQRTLTEFFPQEVLGKEKRYHSSNRMTNALDKLKKRKIK